MENLLILIGFGVVALVCGVSIGGTMESNVKATPVLPDHVAALAQQLGALHVAHQTAEAAKASLAAQLEKHIESLRDLFGERK
jgi:hypothetical protein